MNPLNPIFAILIYATALATAYLINLQYKLSNDDMRFETVAGIRGWSSTFSNSKMNQSESWYADLKHTKGSEQSGLKRVVVVSGNLLDQHLPIPKKIVRFIGHGRMD